MSERSTTFALAAGMGAIAGMRSMSAPALLSRHLSQQKGRGRSAIARLLASRRTAVVLTLSAGGEMVLDKTPFVPSRTEPPSLAGRALAGALSGAVIAGQRGGSQAGAALLGAATALGSAHLVYNLRVGAGERFSVPDAVLGFVEDAVVWVAGSRLASVLE